jgi:hypothetical protein
MAIAGVLGTTCSGQNGMIRKNASASAGPFVIRLLERAKFSRSDAFVFLKYPRHMTLVRKTERQRDGCQTFTGFY